MSLWIIGAVGLLIILVFIEFVVRENTPAFVRRVSEIGMAILGAYIGFTLSLQHEAENRGNQRSEDFQIRLLAAEQLGKLQIQRLDEHIYRLPNDNEIPPLVVGRASAYLQEFIENFKVDRNFINSLRTENVLYLYAPSGLVDHIEMRVSLATPNPGSDLSSMFRSGEFYADHVLTRQEANSFLAFKSEVKRYRGQLEDDVVSVCLLRRALERRNNRSEIDSIFYQAYSRERLWVDNDWLKSMGCTRP
jgi:hypothetical protein